MERDYDQYQYFSGNLPTDLGAQLERNWATARRAFMGLGSARTAGALSPSIYLSIASQRERSRAYSEPNSWLNHRSWLGNLVMPMAVSLATYRSRDDI